MKVKIRGLVFVGFAAAVFAQSAMADANDAKTVTSKLYVDQTFQTLTNEVGIGGTGQSATLDALKQTSDWTSNTKYPSMKVLSDAVGALDDVAGIHGDTNYIAVSEDTNGKKVGIITDNLGTTADIYGNTNTGRLVTVGAVNGLLDTAISGTETNNVVPTSLAVQTYAEANANKATAIITSGTGQNNTTATDGDVKYPTTKAVYDFVTATAGEYQPKTPTTNTTSLYVGRNDTNGSTWNALEAAAAADSQASTDYVTIMDNGSGVYQINIPTAQIATTSDFVASDGNNNATRAKLATAGAVYDFVSGGYQPVAPAGVKVGNNGAWDTLAVDTTYLDLTSATGSVQIGVNAATDSAAISGASTSSSTGASNLTTAYAVNAYVQGLLHGNEIPAMPSECTSAANNGGYCALVYGATTGGGNALQWTVMAPAPATGGGNNP